MQCNHALGLIGILGTTQADLGVVEEQDIAATEKQVADKDTEDTKKQVGDKDTKDTEDTESQNR